MYLLMRIPRTLGHEDIVLEPWQHSGSAHSLEAMATPCTVHSLQLQLPMPPSEVDISRAPPPKPCIAIPTPSVSRQLTACLGEKLALHTHSQAKDRSIAPFSEMDKPRLDRKRGLCQNPVAVHCGSVI